ncbi:hypothetical protein Fmac_023554 [Flemingia macrophylla]|uniref:Uncharacterized protein n=1 Tax=Flemingia macrophylla TaxID=520843 RepID=A0ABD1LLX2_9FABA
MLVTPSSGPKLLPTPTPLFYPPHYISSHFPSLFLRLGPYLSKKRFSTFRSLSSPIPLSKHVVVVTDSSEFIDGDPRPLRHDDEEPKDRSGNEDSQGDDQDLR